MAYQFSKAKGAKHTSVNSGGAPRVAMADAGPTGAKVVNLGRQPGRMQMTPTDNGNPGNKASTQRENRSNQAPSNLGKSSNAVGGVLKKGKNT
jgi:hypothetical protein